MTTEEFHGQTGVRVARIGTGILCRPPGPPALRRRGAKNAVGSPAARTVPLGEWAQPLHHVDVDDRPSLLSLPREQRMRSASPFRHFQDGDQPTVALPTRGETKCPPVFDKYVLGKVMVNEAEPPVWFQSQFHHGYRCCSKRLVSWRNCFTARQQTHGDLAINMTHK